MLLRLNKSILCFLLVILPHFLSFSFNSFFFKLFWLDFWSDHFISLSYPFQPIFGDLKFNLSHHKISASWSTEFVGIFWFLCTWNYMTSRFQIFIADWFCKKIWCEFSHLMSVIVQELLVHELCNKDINEIATIQVSTRLQ